MLAQLSFMPWFIPVTFADNKFRQDFFYRLNVLPIELPPLRDRITDIPIKDADQGRISSFAAGSPDLTALSYKTAKEKILKEFNTYLYRGKAVHGRRQYHPVRRNVRDGPLGSPADHETL